MTSLSPVATQSVQAEGEKSRTATNRAHGLYVHVPFCATACDFCAFYQEAPRRQDLDRYLAAIERELAHAKVSQPFDTVFWGGGTPGLLPARDLERLAKAVHRVGVVEGAEWTVEIAPSTVKPDKIRALLDSGVNRISMGVQSLDPQTLDVLGRTHSRDQVLQAYETIRLAGATNVNLDIIIAIPGRETAAQLADLRAILALGPDHISAYCLTFEDDTKLYARMLRAEIRPLDEELEREQYIAVWETLEAAGFRQYEVSNFARPGRACLHNINTWRMQDWLGVGPSASSQWGGRRFTNEANLDDWCCGVDAGLPNVVDLVVLDDEIQFIDSVIFGLRMNNGIDLCMLRLAYPAISGDVFNGVTMQLEAWTHSGLVARSGTRYRLTQDGQLVADRIGSNLLATV